MSVTLPECCVEEDSWVCHTCGEAYGTWFETIFAQVRGGTHG